MSNPPPADVPSGAPEPFHRPPLAAHLAAVRAAWIEASQHRGAEHPALEAALDTLAAASQAEGVPVVALLKAVDSIARRERGGDPNLDWDSMRRIVGTRVIRRYYADA